MLDKDKQVTEFSESISRFGFIIFSLQYLTFLFFEYLKPGFVTNYMSPHAFLIVALVFGLWWIFVSREEKISLKSYLLYLLIGIVLAAVVLTEAQGLGIYRYFTAFVALILPVIAVKVVKKCN